MRVAPDTNVVVSGLLWYGHPRRILDAARAGRVTLFTSAILLAELNDVLTRPKLARRLAQAGVDAATLVVGFAALAVLVRPAIIPAVIITDPDDDAVLACAIAVHAEAIVSGDSHLLQLGQYQGIPIWNPAQLVAAMP
jgi:putative PIN family toxin of toxin-antitoxin system